MSHNLRRRQRSIQIRRTQVVELAQAWLRPINPAIRHYRRKRYLAGRFGRDMSFRFITWPEAHASTSVFGQQPDIKIDYKPEYLLRS
jgi:hypothetical protein